MQASAQVARISGHGTERRRHRAPVKQLRDDLGMDIHPEARLPEGWRQAFGARRCPAIRLPISATFPFSQPGGSRAIDSAG